MASKESSERKQQQLQSVLFALQLRYGRRENRELGTHDKDDDDDEKEEEYGRAKTLQRQGLKGILQ